MRREKRGVCVKENVIVAVLSVKTENLYKVLPLSKWFVVLEGRTQNWGETQENRRNDSYARSDLKEGD